VLNADSFERIEKLLPDPERLCRPVTLIPTGAVRDANRTSHAPAELVALSTPEGH
jgi:hypothetical protein